LVRCVAGALSFAEYAEGLGAVGFTDVSITSTHELMPGIHSAIVKATKPATARTGPEITLTRELPVVRSSCC
jgi:arsenite methyltransferase